ncbi:MAG TPA: DUF883 family protein [Steroidobacteraceae bacterium]|nr:DUF883 family protein [Steroidobacteraceae bacterium]
MNASASALPAVDELRSVVLKAEKLLSALENSGEETVVKLRTRATQALSSAKDRLQSIDAKTRDSVRNAAKATDEYVHENPWQTIGYGIVLGMFVGALLARRV